ncbi:MAG TPA: glutathione transferase GstA [Casimicrobiaceae bacterium]|jgi:glutathione S-transferase|nr:glutathione transferase GstA [Casimicrobiaceae bacterium]
MKLYYSVGACSLSPHIALLEAGLEATLIKVDTKTHKTEDGGDYYAVNPKGYVPLLELDDGDRLTEGPAIVQYLADRNPASKLAPAADTMGRYHLQEWLNFITAELHKQFSPLFQPTTPPEYKEMLKEKIGKRFDWVAQQLQGKDYLMGTTFTVADAYLFTMLFWTKHVGIDLSRWPVLTAYQSRVAARPKVREAMIAEGLIKHKDAVAA